MKNPKHYILSLFFASLTSLLCAQNGFIEVGARGGNNATFGNFTALSLVAHHTLESNFALEGGIQQSSYERFSAEVRPSFRHNLGFGDLELEALAHYATLNNIHTYALGVGVGITTTHFFATAGYYFRALRSSPSCLSEPFNLYYEFGVSCLPSLMDWDLRLSLTNSRMFDLERHYQPSLYVDGWWYPSERMGVTLGVCYKPTGVFHISSDFYQLYANIGLCYKW